MPASLRLHDIVKGQPLILVGERYSLSKTQIMRLDRLRSLIPPPEQRQVTIQCV